jgi:hypothetical protein
VGHDWLTSFLSSNKELSIRKSQGFSVSRSEGRMREEVNGFFGLLSNVYDENDFFNVQEIYLAWTNLFSTL